MNIIIQFFKFLGISGIGWLMDFTAFNLLHLAIENVMVCNMISSLLGVTFVFIASTRKTFIQKEDGIKLKYKFIIYVIYQILLILVMSKILSVINSLLLNFLAETSFEKFSAMASKILVTPITMTLNFIVMKLLIEKI